MIRETHGINIMYSVFLLVCLHHNSKTLVWMTLKLLRSIYLELLQGRIDSRVTFSYITIEINEINLVNALPKNFVKSALGSPLSALIFSLFFVNRIP